MAALLDELSAIIFDELSLPMSDEQAGATGSIQSAFMARSGIPDPVPVQADPVNGNKAVNSGGTAFRIQNTDSVQHSVTFITIFSSGSHAVADDVVPVPAGTTVWTGRFHPYLFGGVISYVADSSNILISVFEP